MNVYFAPMEGVTDAIFRRVHHRNFGGVTKYFMPFISPAHSLTFSRRERFDMSTEQNAGVPVVPQILTNNPEYFDATARMLRDFGYTELNLNLGCPSSTVTAKGKGSGLLRAPDDLRRLLDSIYAHPVLPVSIKTRIGYSDPAEWPALLAMYREYPVSELIVHPRTRQEFYNGTPHLEACGLIDGSFIYNGDLFTTEDIDGFMAQFPQAAGVMLGRGLVANPALAQQCQGGDALTLDALCAFHDDLYQEYLRFWPESAVIGRMHLILKYLSGCFEDTERIRRVLRKVRTAAEYEAAIQQLFHGCPFKDKPVFDLNILLS